MRTGLRKPTRKHPGFQIAEETPQGRAFVDTLADLLGGVIHYRPTGRTPDGSHMFECWGPLGTARLLLEQHGDGVDCVSTYTVLHELVSGAPAGVWVLKLVTRRALPERAERAGVAAPQPGLSKAATRRWWESYRAARGSEHDEMTHEFCPLEPYTDAGCSMELACRACGAIASRTQYVPAGEPVRGMAAGVPTDQGSPRFVAELVECRAAIATVYGSPHVAFAAKDTIRRGDAGGLFEVAPALAPAWCSVCKGPTAISSGRSRRT